MSIIIRIATAAAGGLIAGVISSTLLPKIFNKKEKAAAPETPEDNKETE